MLRICILKVQRLLIKPFPNKSKAEDFSESARDQQMIEAMRNTHTGKLYKKTAEKGSEFCNFVQFKGNPEDPDTRSSFYSMNLRKHFQLKLSYVGHFLIKKV